MLLKFKKKQLKELSGSKLILSNKLLEGVAGGTDTTIPSNTTHARCVIQVAKNGK